MAEHPIVTVQDGQLKGKISIDFLGGKYFSFQGIPYAKPPIGELRFKAPQPAEPWSGVWDATYERDGCYSRHLFSQKLVGSEDCLYLSVYTPELPSENNTLKPVMVWIHGGGFIMGSGSVEFYSPDFLLPQDVVLVNFNYRLGLLGFLSMDDPSLGVPGNSAFKDQILALTWVQKNIAKFGGDPNNVTVFGQSSAGAGVHCLMLSPMAKGLFHRVILQSGNALAHWARGQRSPPLVAKALGLNTTDEREILKVLQEMSVEEIFETQQKIPDSFGVQDTRSVGPVVENTSEEPAFLAEEPRKILISGQFNKVPLMIGYTSRDGMVSEMLIKRGKKEHGVIKDFLSEVPKSLKIRADSETLQEIAQMIKTFYYGEEEPSLENIDQFYQLETDNYFLRSIYDTMKLHLAVSSAPIYLYRMSLETNLNMVKKICRIHSQGVCHADDLGYLFKTSKTPFIRPESLEDDGIKRFTKLWATFARNGDPNPVPKDPLINITWKPVEKDKFHFLDIGENLTVGINPEARRMAFWDKIYSMTSDTSEVKL